MRILQVVCIFECNVSCMYVCVCVNAGMGCHLTAAGEPRLHHSIPMCGSTCPFVVAAIDHVKMFPIDTSVTPATYGNETEIMSNDRKLESKIIMR